MAKGEEYLKTGIFSPKKTNWVFSQNRHSDERILSIIIMSDLLVEIIDM